MIRLVDLKKSYGEQVILHDVSLHLQPATRYGLIGANGAGKTTLLKIICKEEMEDGGDVIAPSQCRIAHLPQSPNPNPLESVTAECMTGAADLYASLQKVNQLALELAENYSEQAQESFELAEQKLRMDGGYRLEADAKSLLSGLGFSQEDLVRSPLEFSGGWRMRIELAKILLGNPDVLILDEPTNHLDLPSIVWLESRLKSFEGSLVFVSHDRSLLNRLAQRILYLRGGRLTEFHGNFDKFLTQLEQKESELEKERDRLSAQAAHLEKFAERFGAKATMATRAKSKLKAASKIRALESSLSSEMEEDEEDIHLVLPVCGRSSRFVLSLKDLQIGYEKPLFDPVSLVIERGMRVAMVGSNGVGKSTLLKTVMSECDPKSGGFELGEGVEIEYFAQEQAEVLDQSRTVIDTVLHSHERVDVKLARRLLGALKFSGRSVDKPVSVLSGGEKNRVGLACLLAGQANFLVLDEPTNHLDMSSVETLGDALSAYEGTVLFVSHNREFIDRVCTHVLAVSKNGSAALFEGQLEDYERACAHSGFPNVLSAGQPSLGSDEIKREAAGGADDGKANWEENRAKKREKDKIQRQVKQMEKKLADWAKEKSELEAAMLDVSPDNYEELQTLASKVSKIDSNVEETEEKWMMLSEQLEAE